MMEPLSITNGELKGKQCERDFCFPRNAVAPDMTRMKYFSTGRNKFRETSEMPALSVRNVRYLGDGESAAHKIAAAAGCRRKQHFRTDR